MSFRVLNYKYMVHIKFMEGFLEYNNILLGMSKTIISSRGRQYTVRYQETAQNFP